MKEQNNLNSFCLASGYSKQAGCLNGCLLRAILRKRPLHLHLWATGRAGIRNDVAVGSVIRLLPVCFIPAIRWQHTIYSLSSQGVKGVTNEDQIFPIADAQSASTYTHCSVHSLHVPILFWVAVSMRLCSLFVLVLCSYCKRMKKNNICNQPFSVASSPKRCIGYMFHSHIITSLQTGLKCNFHKYQ